MSTDTRQPEPTLSSRTSTDPHWSERGGHTSAGRTERKAALWILGGLLLVVPALRLPDAGVWLGVKTLVLEGAGILLAVFAFSRREWNLEQARRALLSGPNPMILAFLIWISLSAVRSDLPAFSRPELMRHVGGILLYFAVLYGTSGRGDVRRLVSVVQIAASLGAILAFSVAVSDNGNTPIGAFRNEQLFAGFLCLLFPVLVMALIAEEDPMRRLIGQAPVILAGAGLLLTGNRSAWGGTLVAMAVAGWLIFRYRCPRGGFRLERHQIVNALLLVGACTALFLVVSQTGGTLSRRGQTLTKLQQDNSFQERLGAWRAATHMIQERPLLGWGVGTYPMQQALFNPFSRDQAAIAAEGGLSENAHNSYLQTAAELGIPGVLLYIGIPVAFLITAWRSLKTQRQGFRQAALIGLMAGVVGQMVTALANPAWEFPECSLFYWFVLGLGMVAAGLGFPDPSQTGSEGTRHSRARSVGEAVGARGT